MTPGNGSDLRHVAVERAGSRTERSARQGRRFAALSHLPCRSADCVVGARTTRAPRRRNHAATTIHTFLVGSSTTVNSPGAQSMSHHNFSRSPGRVNKLRPRHTSGPSRCRVRPATAGTPVSSVLRPCPSSRAGPVPSQAGVRSMITVTYLSPRRVCRQACSSTPTTRTLSKRCGSLLKARRPSASTAGLPCPAGRPRSRTDGTTHPAPRHAPPAPHDPDPTADPPPPDPAHPDRRR